MIHTDLYRCRRLHKILKQKLGKFEKEQHETMSRGVEYVIETVPFKRIPIHLTKSREAKQFFA
jgi:hypothetical protein